MNSSWKPAGYNSASPYLIVTGAAATIDFLKTVFNAEVLHRHEDDNGGVMHAEVRLDDTVIMLGDAGPQWPAMPAYVHVFVPDVDEAYRKALAAGGTSVQEPIKKQDADKRGGVKDAGGTTWWISTKVE
jgi:uncharacterized glyoxalase superfamily protein PhnB